MQGDLGVPPTDAHVLGGGRGDVRAESAHLVGLAGEEGEAVAG